MDAAQARSPSLVSEVPQSSLVETEEWRQIEEFPSYEVSSFGRVRNALTGHPTRVIVNPRGGYLAVKMYASSLRSVKTRQIHRLVLTAFHRPRPKDTEANHIDGNKQNNHADNLEWVTHGENMRHAYKIGLVRPRQGEAMHNARLTDAIVLEMRRIRRDTGITYEELGKMFGVRAGFAWNVVSGKRWKHI